MDGWLMRHCMNGYSAVSHAVASHFTAQLGLAPVHVIPNAFPIEDLKPVAGINRAAIFSGYNISPDDFVIVTPARLVPSKGHRFLIQSLEILREHGLSPKVLILGHGPLESALTDEVTQRGLEKQVTLCGRIPQTQLLPIIQVADAVVLPSTHEGFGLAPAEAMALETPVLASRVGGLVDLIEEGVSGLMVPPGDARGLADGIARLMQDAALRDRLGQAGRLRIVEHFSADVVAGQWDEFYRDLFPAPR
jgi:glycosyltransferase involved in cell wall biosynthesis